MLGKKAAWFFAGKALYSWWRSREIRAENAGRFLDSDERKDLLSPKNQGLTLDGGQARLSADASFRNLAALVLIPCRWLTPMPRCRKSRTS